LGAPWFQGPGAAAPLAPLRARAAYIGLQKTSKDNKQKRNKKKQANDIRHFTNSKLWLVLLYV